MMTQEEQRKQARIKCDALAQELRAVINARKARNREETIRGYMEFERFDNDLLFRACEILTEMVRIQRELQENKPQTVNNKEEG